jgi:hypothetical protein
MAAATSFIPPNTTQNTLLKLDSGNYTSWLTQINPILRTHELMGFVDGPEPCPPKTITDAEGKVTPNLEYHTWNKTDQYLLSVITGSLSEKVFSNCLWPQHLSTSMDNFGYKICLKIQISHLQLEETIAKPLPRSQIMC